MESISSGSDFLEEVTAVTPSYCEPCKKRLHSRNQPPIAFWYCKECEQLLCGDCKTWHLSKGATKSHQVESVEQVFNKCELCAVKLKVTVIAPWYCKGCEEFVCGDCKRWHKIVRRLTDHEIVAARKWSDSKKPLPVQNPLSIRTAQGKPFSQRLPKFKQKVNAKVRGDKQTCWISASAFLPDARLLLIDCVNDKLKVFNRELQFVCSKVFNSCPSDVAVLEVDEVAVSFPDEKVVRRFSVREAVEEISAIKIPHRCVGLVYLDSEQMAVVCQNPGCVCVIQRDGAVTKYHSEQAFQSPIKIVLNAALSIMYVSDPGSNAVYGLNLNSSDSKFSYKHEELYGPAGVTVDLESNIYVCGVKSNNVHQISQDGRHCKVLLSSDDIKSPLSMSFYPGGESFVLTSVEDFVSIYDMV